MGLLGSIFTATRDEAFANDGGVSLMADRKFPLQRLTDVDFKQAYKSCTGRSIARTAGEPFAHDEGYEQVTVVLDPDLVAWLATLNTESIKAAARLIAPSEQNVRGGPSEDEWAEILTGVQPVAALAIHASQDVYMWMSL